VVLFHFSHPGEDRGNFDTDECAPLKSQDSPRFYIAWIPMGLLYVLAIVFGGMFRLQA